MEYKLKVDDVKKHYREYEMSGDISVQNLESLVLEFKGCIADCDELLINMKKISGFDTAAFQFFYSLKNSFIRDKKKLTVNAELLPEVSQLLSNCGIGNLSEVLSIKDDK